MADSGRTIDTTITLIAATVAAATAIAIPTIFFATAYYYEASRIEEEAERAALVLSEIAVFSPRMWRFQTHKMEEGLAPMFGRGRSGRQRVMDLEGRLDQEFGGNPPVPTLSRTADVYDGASLVGRVKVTQSVRHVWLGTFGAAALGLVLGAAMFVALRVLPLRALTRALAQLRDAQGEIVRGERLAAVGQVTATVAHELRNPLGAIRSALATIKTLARKSAPQLAEHPMMEDSLAIADRGITRCDRIIGEMLDHTRVRELKRSPMRVDEWLDRRLEAYDTPAHISLRRALISGVEISLDRDRFDQAVRNVIDNACQAFDGATTVGDGAAECQVAVATRRVGQRLEVSISDNGVGISPQAMARVFEPLYSTKAFGVGLGMPLVRQVMEQHGGGVEISSEEGRGTEVVLWLPLERTADETAA